MSRPGNSPRLPILGDAHRPPRTRGECIRGTPKTGSLEERRAGKVQCAAYECRHNLLAIPSAEVPGRRYDGLAPEWTLTDRGTASSPSCALDESDAGPKSCAEIARIMGFRDKRRVEQILHDALQSQGAAELLRLHGALGDD